MCAAALATAGPASAASDPDYYVAANGKATSTTCSEQAPCASISDALTVAAKASVDAATIHLGSGTFPTTVSVAGGAWVVEGSGVGDTTVVPSSTDPIIGVTGGALSLAKLT